MKKIKFYLLPQANGGKINEKIEAIYKQGTLGIKYYVYQMVKDTTDDQKNQPSFELMGSLLKGEFPDEQSILAQGILKLSKIDSQNDREQWATDVIEFRENSRFESILVIIKDFTFRSLFNAVDQIKNIHESEIYEMRVPLDLTAGVTAIKNRKELTYEDTRPQEYYGQAVPARNAKSKDWYDFGYHLGSELNFTANVLDKYHYKLPKDLNQKGKISDKDRWTHLLPERRDLLDSFWKGVQDGGIKRKPPLEPVTNTSYGSYSSIDSDFERWHQAPSLKDSFNIGVEQKNKNFQLAPAHGSKNTELLPYIRDKQHYDAYERGYNSVDGPNDEANKQAAAKDFGRSTKSTSFSENNAPTNCPHQSDGAIVVAEFIVQEIKTNVASQSATLMRDYNDFGGRMKAWQALPLWQQVLTPPPETMLGNALAVWTERVAQNRPWDHKPIIKAKFKEVAVKRPLKNIINPSGIGQLSESHYHKYKKHDYFHDIWSNIHYGYVGMSSGFDESLLLDGAGLEQIGSSWVRMDRARRTGTTGGMRDYDDVGDRVSIELGVSLFKQYGRFAQNLTAAAVLAELEKIPSQGLSDSRLVHVCLDKTPTQFTKE